MSEGESWQVLPEGTKLLIRENYIIHEYIMYQELNQAR